MMHLCLIIRVHGSACAGALKLSDALLNRKNVPPSSMPLLIATTVTDPSASVLELVWEQMLFSSDLVAPICPLPMHLVE